MSLRTLLPCAALILPTIATISLSGFQSIVGFPQACTDAYNQQIGGCDPSTDVGRGHTCSIACQAALTTVQVQIEISCKGISVDPSSVLAQFYYGRGPAFVCSGIDYYEAASSNSASVTSTSVSTSTVTETVSTPSSLTSTSQPTTTTLTQSLSSALHHPPSSAQSTSRVTTTISSSTTTTFTPVTTETVHPSSVSPSFLSTAAYKGTATVFTSQPQRTGSSNPDKYGGGGSPFEISANGNGVRTGGEPRSWLMLVVMVFLGANAILS